MVVHYANKTRITCANFVQISAGHGSNATNATSTRPPYSANGTVTVTTRIPSATATGGAGDGEDDSTGTPVAPEVATSTGAANAGMWLSSGAILAAVGAFML